jgi:N-methylhydantoinase A
MDDSGILAFGKVPTDAEDPSRAVEEGLVATVTEAGVSLEQVRQVMHGTTLATNAILERKGSRTALLTTAGFRDAIEIGRERRWELYDLEVEAPRPLAPRHLRFDVPERTLSDGTVTRPVDLEYVERLVAELCDAGVEAVAICFLHSFVNPENERAAREAVIRVGPGLRVSISSDVVPELREFERTSTTLANVYVQELTSRYLTRIRRRLKTRGFRGSLFVMLSSGGVCTVDTALRYPVRLLESGPAAGALAAAAVGNAYGSPDLLSFDMGGTTAKLCLTEGGAPLVTGSFEVDRRYRLKKGSGLPISAPVIDMLEIGAGGGSVASVDALGLIKVGPQSAGAHPGPACYGHGGDEPTVTDADLILGYLDPGEFLGGRMLLDVGAAERVLAREVATPLGLSIAEAAYGVHQVVNENMANAARVHAIERGKEARKLSLCAFGGAGPVHAAGVARAIGVRRVIVPLGAGVMSSLGLLAAPLAFDAAHSAPGIVDELGWEEIESLLLGLETSNAARLAQAGLVEEQITHKRVADMRYVGQGHQISVELPEASTALAPEGVREAFQAVYRRVYRREGPDVPIEVMTWRVVSSGPRPAVHLARPRATAKTSGQAAKSLRHAYFPSLGGYARVAVYDRYRLPAGAVVAGPAIIEETESTLVVGPDDRAKIDTNLVLTLEVGPTC